MTFIANQSTLQDMKSKVLISLILIFSPLIALAQGKANTQTCDITPMKIIELGEPDFKAPIIMESSYKLSGIKNILDADFAHNTIQNQEFQNYVLLGNYSKEGDPSKTYPFLTVINQKGQVIWDALENSQFQLEAIQLLKNKYGYVVLGNIRHPTKGRGFYLAQYSKLGKRLRQTPFYTAGFNSFAKSMTYTGDGKGYLVAIDRVSKDGKKIATVYRVDAEGFSPWDKKYPMKGSSVFENIQLLRDKGYIVTGSVEQEDGRMAGWLFNMTELGIAGWQKTYVRGVNASLHQAVALKNGSYLLAGYTQSFFGDKKTAWVMNVGENSVPLWQRFYTGNYDYNIKDLKVDSNNLITILMDAQPLSKKEKEDNIKRKGHLVLLTLSPRGDVLYEDSFEGGDNSFATSLFKGKDTEHIIMGMKQYLPPPDMMEQSDVQPINEGWLLFSPSFSDYVDSCAQEKSS